MHSDSEEAAESSSSSNNHNSNDDNIDDDDFAPTTRRLSRRNLVRGLLTSFRSGLRSLRVVSRPRRTVRVDRGRALEEDAVHSRSYKGDEITLQRVLMTGDTEGRTRSSRIRAIQGQGQQLEEEVEEEPTFRGSELTAAEGNITSTSAVVVTQVDYVGYLIPKLMEIVSCPFYWGKIDRYEAERLLEQSTEGSFLLRDSAQDEFVFSVSFRRYNRSLHARIEESSHQFSFDCHDPGVHRADTVTGLLEHYKDPLSCMFFEPMLLHPVPRKQAFSLQELARAVICDRCTYNAVGALPIPRPLQNYLREYNYKHKIRTRQIITQETDDGEKDVAALLGEVSVNVKDSD